MSNNVDTRIKDLEDKVQLLKDSLEVVGNIAEMLMVRVYPDVLEQTQDDRSYIQKQSWEIYELNDILKEKDWTDPPTLKKGFYSGQLQNRRVDEIIKRKG